MKQKQECQKCARLVNFITHNKGLYPDFYNAPVPSFGDEKGQILIVGLAPGLKGANRTGRPFTGDYAGDLLYKTLLDFGLAKGVYRASAEDGLCLCGARITNAVRCVPPQNKVTGEEVKNCSYLLQAEINAMTELKLIIALGAVAHGAVLAACGVKKSECPFAHGAEHKLNSRLRLIDSYHCSRYNTNTGRLTENMFREVFVKAEKYLNSSL